MDNIFLALNSVTKKFASVTAVNNLSFSVKRGEIFALLGPNGAGKTTTVRLLMNIIHPDSGTIEFFSSDGTKFNPSSSDLGYLPEERGLYQDVPIIKTLIYMGLIRGMSRKESAASAEKWLERLKLIDRKKEKLSTLSKGNQQKIQFISSVIHNPSFAILDEPFSGFDPVNQELFIEIIKDFKLNGTTILLSAHQMHLVERIADRILLMNNGAKIAEGAVNEIKEENDENDKIIFTINSVPDLKIFEGLTPKVTAEVLDGNRISIKLSNNGSLSGILKTVSSSYEISDLNIEKTGLHEIFLSKVAGNNGVENE